MNDEHQVLCEVSKCYSLKRKSPKLQNVAFFRRETTNSSYFWLTVKQRAEVTSLGGLQWIWEGPLLFGAGQKGHPKRF